MTALGSRGAARAVIVTVAAAIVAVLCWMSANDRIAIRSAHPEKAYFGGAAAAQIAFARLNGGDPQGALAAARRAVRTAPVDPASTSALGSSLLLLNRPEAAYSAFGVAGLLGWRDVPTQLYWLAQAGAVGDVGVVAQRLDALLRLDIDNAAVTNSLNMLGRSDLGQQALAMLLANDPPWERLFLIGTGKLEGADLAGRMAAVDLAVKRGAAMDCEAVGVAANLLIRNGNPAMAKRFWRDACERSGNALLSDGGFDTDPSATSRSPFVWQLQSQGGLDVSVQPAPKPLGGNALKITSSQTSRTIAAMQLTALQPGSYRLSWTAVRDDGAPDAGVAMLIRCGESGGMLELEATREADRPARASAIFTVPADGCPIQTIAIQKAASSPGETETGWIDDIAIASLDSGGRDAGR